MGAKRSDNIKIYVKIPTEGNHFATVISKILDNQQLQLQYMKPQLGSHVYITPSSYHRFETNVEVGDTKFLICLKQIK
jgi:hypothetical protein